MTTTAARGSDPEALDPVERAHGAFMQIGEVASRTELSLRSLRHWEEVGLLTPSGRSEGGFRLYTEEDVEKILSIRRMKPLGFSLEQMKDTLVHIETLRDRSAPQADRTAARAFLDTVQDAATERRGALVRQIEMADEFLGLIADLR